MNKGFCCIGLFNPKSPENVGSVMRAAGCYGVNSVFYTGLRYDRAKEFVTDTKKVHQKIPLIGSIACGEPITAEQNIEKMVDVPENIRCDFSLTCHGDSMVDAGIHDKDVVYIRIQPEVENGEIAAVRIDGEATLKRVYYNPGTLTLMPANPAYAPMIYTGSQLEEVHIEGKAVGWTHWVG